MEKKLMLNAKVRTLDEKAKLLRGQRLIPWVVYGRHQDVINLKVEYSDFLRLFRVAWESKIIDLNVDWKSIEVLIHKVDKKPINWEYEHIDFYAITKGEKVTTNIHLSFVGTAKASMEWAIIEEHLKELKIKVLPKDLVDSIEVNLDKLEKIWDIIRISDLEIDREKFEILDDAESVIVSANKPKEEKAEEVVEEVAEAAEATAEWEKEVA